MSSILYERDVENATNVAGSEPDWGKLVEFCNRVQNSVGSSAMKGALLAIMKRVKHRDEHIQLQALALLESCVSNCGNSFRAEMSDNQVLADLTEVAKGERHSSAVSGRMRGLISSWVSEFGHESGFAAVRQLKDSLSAQGLQFPSSVARGGASSAPQSSSQREMDDLKRAIELSLQEQPKTTPPSSSLYPIVGGVASQQNTWSTPKPNVKKCRALFDFQAAEDNELTFRSGEVIEVLDDRDKHWWKGRTAQGEGLFPSNFVTLDLAVSKPNPKKTKLKSSVKPGKVTRVNEEVIDLCLDMLRSADATASSKEEGSMLLDLEGQCRQMRPLVEAKIASLEREETALQGLNEEYQGAIALYRQLLSAGVPSNPPPQTTPFATSQHMHGAPPPTYQAPAATYQPGGVLNPAYQPGGGVNATYQVGGGANPTYQPGGGANPTYQPGGNVNPTYQPGGGANPTYQPGGSVNPTYQPGGGANPTYQPGGGANPTYQPGGGANPTYQPGGGANPAYQPGGGANPTYQPGGGANHTYQPGGGANPAYQPGGGANPTYQPGGGANPAYQPGSGIPATYQPALSASSGAGLQQGSWVPGGSMVMLPSVGQDLREPDSLGTPMY